MPFYSGEAWMGERGLSSNFAKHDGFSFEIPGVCVRDPEWHVLNEVECKCAVKAISLCKAAVFGDALGFAEIVKAEGPGQAKALGGNWDVGS